MKVIFLLVAICLGALPASATSVAYSQASSYSNYPYSYNTYSFRSGYGSLPGATAYRLGYGSQPGASVFRPGYVSQPGAPVFRPGYVSQPGAPGYSSQSGAPGYGSQPAGPVCGVLNGYYRTFPSLQAFLDAVRNGLGYKFHCNGPCPSFRPPVAGCPRIYDPVCATNLVVSKTFNNYCLLAQESAQTGVSK